MIQEENFSKKVENLQKKTNKKLNRVGIARYGKSFEARSAHSEKHQEEIDEIYRKIIPMLYSSQIIDGSNVDENKLILDTEYSMDVTLTLTTGIQLSLQEKFLYTNYHTLTIEFLNDENNLRESGDWFNLANVQMYFIAYFPKSYEDRLTLWVLIDLEKLWKTNEIDWCYNRNKKGNATASFLYTNFLNLPDDCIMACGTKNDFTIKNKNKFLKNVLKLIKDKQLFL